MLTSLTNLALTIVRMKNRVRIQAGRGLWREEEEPLFADQLREDVLLLVVVHRG